VANEALFNHLRRLPTQNIRHEIFKEIHSVKKKTPEEKTKIKPSYKHRVPHKPTKVHRNRKKYTRKGKTRDQREKELIENGDKNDQG
jgi:hypothetical protein